MTIEQIKRREETRTKNKALIKSNRLVIKTESKQINESYASDYVNAYLDGVLLVSWGFMPKDIISTFDFEEYAKREATAKLNSIELEKKYDEKTEELKNAISAYGFTLTRKEKDSSYEMHDKDGNYLFTIHEMMHKSNEDLIIQARQEKRHGDNYKINVETLRKALEDKKILSYENHACNWLFVDLKNRVFHIDFNEMQWDFSQTDFIANMIASRDNEEAAKENQKKADESLALKLIELGYKVSFNGSRWLVKYRNSKVFEDENMTRNSKYQDYIKTTPEDFVPVEEINDVIQAAKTLFRKAVK